MHLMKYRDSGLVIPVKTAIAGKYRIQVYRPDGRCRHDTGWFDNLVLDGGLEHMGATNNYASYVSVGSGDTTPANVQTALSSFVAATSTVEETTTAAQGSAPYYSTWTRRWRFAVGDAEGNLAEVGVGPNNTGTNLFSRSLITDGGGTPTTITVLADEFLDVTYQLQCVPPTGDTTPTVVDSGPAGTSYNLTIRAAGVTSPGCVQSGGWEPANGTPIALRTSSNVSGQAFDGSIGAITGSPSGSTTNIGGTNDSYVGASLEKTATISLGLDTGNFGSGISAITFVFCNGGGGWQVGFSPAISKTNTDTLAFDVKTSWTRTTAQ